MASEASKHFVFGGFEVRADRREVLAGGVPVEIEPRVFDLLVYLIEHRDAAVSKDELLAAIWPGAYVSESSLTRCVMKARRAVGDDADKQELIKTIHGHGYRFIGELEPASEPEPEEIAHSIPAAPGSATPRRWWPGLALGAVIVLAVAALVMLVPGSAPPGKAGAPSVAVLPVYNDTGDDELDWVALGLMTAIGDQISRDGSLQLIGANDVIKGLRQVEQGLDEGSFPSAEVAEVAAFQQFGVTYLVSASLSQRSGLYRLQASILSPGESVATFDLFGDQPTRLAKQLSQAIVQELASNGLDANPAVAISEDEFVNEAYLRGKEQVLRGEIDNAIHLLSIAVAQEPDSFLARRALAGAWLANGEAERALAVYDTLIAEAREQGLRLEEAKLLTLIALALRRKAEYDEAEALYFTAADIYEELGLPLERAKVLFNLAWIAGQRSELNLERARLETAAREFEAAGVAMNSGAVLLALGNHALDQGDVDAGEQYFTDALNAFRSGGLRNDEAIAIYSLSRVAELRGDFEQAASLALASRDLARDFGQPWTEALGWRRMGMVDMARGRLDSAESGFNQAMDISRRIGSTDTLTSTTAQLAEVHRMSGRLEEAEQRLDEAAALVEAGDIDLGRRWLQIYRGRLALTRGDALQAALLAEEALSETRDMIRLYRGDALYLLAMAYGEQDRHEDALPVLRAGIDAADQMGDQVELARFAATLGLYELAHGNPELAPGYLGMAQEAAPATYFPLVLEGVLAARDGDDARAAALFARAKQVAADLWSAQDARWTGVFTSG